MSASAAAAALIQHDADIAAQVVRFDRTDDENRYRLSRRDEGVAILESALGTWTLALAAAAAPTPAPLLAQDVCRPLSVALASKPDAPMHAREASAAIKAAPLEPVNEPATVNMGALADMLGFSLRADFIATVLNIQPAGRAGAAVLYRPSQVPLIVAALQRHLDKWWNGEMADPATGVPHLANACACLAILIDAEMSGKCVDDRPPAQAELSNYIDKRVPGGIEKLREVFGHMTPHHWTISDELPDA